MSCIKELREYLRQNIKLLTGSFVQKKDKYETDFCNILSEMTLDESRYWDCFYTTNLGEKIFIELKKGKSIWIDLVRYSEVLLKKTADSKIKTITIFLIPNKEKTKITHIYAFETDRLINSVFNLDESKAISLINLKETLPHSLNAQASLTLTTLKNNHYFEIQLEE